MSGPLWERAKGVLVGGVNSPVRAFKAVGGEPIFISEAKGSKIFDADRNEFIDFVCSWGALILGSAHPAVIHAIAEAAKMGTSFGAPTEGEVAMAELIRSYIPSMEMIRFVNSGTEANMSAIRLARAFTRRQKILKFEGCYHGHADPLLAKAGSGVATFGIPSSAGVPDHVVRDTLVVPYNDLQAVQRAYSQHTDSIAATIVEPVAANMGVVPPDPSFLNGLRSVTKTYGSLLIFDEVITGFRLTLGGAQSVFGIDPDLTCLGKIIGGGLPVGAYGGRREVMEMLAPLGPVYQAGTLSGNPLTMQAGLATLRQLGDELYRDLERRSSTLAKGIHQAAERAGVNISLNRAGSMMSIFFTKNRVMDYTSARSAHTRLYGEFFWSSIHRGIYLPPSPLEAIFMSAAHSDNDVSYAIDAMSAAMAQLSDRK